MQRGKINNEGRAKQINGFSDLIYGKISPTDLDGLIEYKNQAYVFFEVKYKETELPKGQRIAIERLVKDTSHSKKTMAIICEHNEWDINNEIYVADTVVREIYMYNELKWRKPNRKIKTKECIDLFINEIVEKDVKK